MQSLGNFLVVSEPCEDLERRDEETYSVGNGTNKNMSTINTFILGNIGGIFRC